MQAVTSAAPGPQSARGPLAFGPFVFDRVNGLLSKDGVEVSLPPRVLGVLALLLERPGQLVTKQELIASVWRDAFVTETSLAEAISVLRQALGDEPQRPLYIQTLHRRGYRFIAELRAPSIGGTHGSNPAGPSAALVVSPGPTAPDEAGARARGFERRVDDSSVASEPRLSLLVPWLIALFAIIVAGSAVWRYLDSAAPPPRQPVRASIALPPGVVLAAEGAPIAISPDGMVIAFAGCRGECGIYLRPLSQPAATLVAGTSGGGSPFFSPDGRWLGFFAHGRLYKIAIAGGSPVPLAEAPASNGATWLRDGAIVFSGRTGGGLSIVPSEGGAVRRLTAPSPEDGAHTWPDALPDASGVVFTVGGPARSDRQYAAVVSLRTGAWSRLLDGVSAARVPTTGYLLAQRGPDLVGAAFDARALSIGGPAVSLMPGALDGAGAPRFAMSATGVLVSGREHAPALEVVLDWTSELQRLVPAPQPRTLR